MQCVLSAAVNRSSTDTYRTYWFGADVVDTMVGKCEAGTLDLINSDYDDYIIDTNYEGMDHFDLRRTGANGFIADKYMLSNSTSYTYTVNKDIRYDILDEVDIWTFFRGPQGAITMLEGLNRTLGAM